MVATAAVLVDTGPLVNDAALTGSTQKRGGLCQLGMGVGLGGCSSDGHRSPKCHQVGRLETLSVPEVAVC